MRNIWGAAGSGGLARPLAVMGRCLFGAAAIAVLAGCSQEGGGADARGAASSPEVRVLSWDDLMPEGEIERLQELYLTYFEEMVEQKIAAQATLPEAARAAQDGETAEGAEDGEDAMFDPTMIPEGSALDTMPQLGTYNVVEELDGQKVRLPGFVVPLEFAQTNSFSEFLLVPYFGACIHSPPPPPNQIVYVRTDTPAVVERLWDPVWAEGLLTTEENINSTGSAAYTLTLSALRPYE